MLNSNDLVEKERNWIGFFFFLDYDEMKLFKDKKQWKNLKCIIRFEFWYKKEKGRGLSIWMWEKKKFWDTLAFWLLTSHVFVDDFVFFICLFGPNKTHVLGQVMGHFYCLLSSSKCNWREKSLGFGFSFVTKLHHIVIDLNHSILI